MDISKARMEFNDFCTQNTRMWSTYLKAISDDMAKGAVTLVGGRLLFPNIVLYTETPDHYLAELFGATLRFQGLVEKMHKETSVLKYLYQFADDVGKPKININGRNIEFRDFLISRQVDTDKVKARFGFDPYRLYLTKVVLKGSGGGMLSFGPNFESFYLDNCLLINTVDQVYRMKDILHLTVVSKFLPLPDFVQEQRTKLLWPVDNRTPVSGIHYVPNNAAEPYILSGQFVNLFLIPGFRETNIGKFLHEHPTILMKALNYAELLYEKPFTWQEGNRDPSKNSIKPDFLLRPPGVQYWDICDIKRPLLDRTTLTKGGLSRRRFIDEVGEGIAQLANYENYFQFEGNAAFVKKKYGVEVKSPELILIVGNYENANHEEVQEALRSMKPNYTILDYDSLNVAYLAKAIAGLAKDPALNNPLDAMG